MDAIKAPMGSYSLSEFYKNEMVLPTTVESLLGQQEPLSPVDLQQEPVAYVLPLLSLDNYMVIAGKICPRSVAMQKYQQSLTHYNALQQEGYRADPIMPLPLEMQAMAQEVLARHVTQQGYSVGRVSIGLVNMKQACIYQDRINLSHITRLEHELDTHTDENDIFDFCLPRNGRANSINKVIQPMSNMPNSCQFTLVSPSIDFRFLEPQFLDCHGLDNQQILPNAKALVGLAVGHSPNYVSVVKFQDRLFLHNGTHRSVALLKRGISQVPCLIQEAETPIEFQMCLGQPAQTLQFGNPRPVLLKDYLDPLLTDVIDTPRLQTVSLSECSGMSNICLWRLDSRFREWKCFTP